jgi:hypothetical protein
MGATFRQPDGMEITPGLIDSAAILRTRGGTDSIHRDFRAGKLERRGFYVLRLSGCALGSR